MPFRPARTERASIFAALIAEGATPRAAATSAGYKSPASSANAMLKRSDVRQKINAIAHARNILEESAPLIASIHAARLTSGKTTNREFAQLSSIYYKTVGMMEERPADTKELHEMSTDELKAVINTLEGEAATRAKPIGGVFG